MAVSGGHPRSAFEAGHRLKNPAYAGAFVYGRTRLRAARDDNLAAKVAKPIEEWRIVVKDRYPAYIDWPTYEKRHRKPAPARRSTACLILNPAPEV